MSKSQNSPIQRHCAAEAGASYGTRTDARGPREHRNLAGTMVAHPAIEKSNPRNAVQNFGHRDEQPDKERPDNHI
jgi:hypothetical protein